MEFSLVLVLHRGNEFHKAKDLIQHTDLVSNLVLLIMDISLTSVKFAFQHSEIYKQTKQKKLRGLSQLLRIESDTWSARRISTAVFWIF
jgi:hypothetical protein